MRRRFVPVSFFEMAEAKAIVIRATGVSAADIAERYVQRRLFFLMEDIPIRTQIKVRPLQHHLKYWSFYYESADRFVSIPEILSRERI